MSQLLPILFFEEGYRNKAYIDSEGYPSIGYGIRIGPKGAILENYTFSVSKRVGEAWMEDYIDKLKEELRNMPQVAAALMKCNAPRTDVLYSMAYQMGLNGLAGFKDMLSMVRGGNFSGASHEMLNSLWSRQTPERAIRHAEVMRTGTYDCYKGKL